MLNTEIKKYFQQLISKGTAGYMELLRDLILAEVDPRNRHIWLEKKFRCEEIAEDITDVMEDARQLAIEEEEAD